jgi:hypothetical protein
METSKARALYMAQRMGKTIKNTLPYNPNKPTILLIKKKTEQEKLEDYQKKYFKRAYV